MSRNKVRWDQDSDDNGNDVWIASSPYEEGFMWRLKQRLVDNKIEWYEAHDAELIGSDGPLSWSTLEEAQAAIDEAHANIIADNSA